MCSEMQIGVVKALLCSVHKSHTNQHMQPFVTVSQHCFCVNDAFVFFQLLSLFCCLFCILDANKV